MSKVRNVKKKQKKKKKVAEKLLAEKDELLSLFNDWDGENVPDISISAEEIAHAMEWEKRSRYTPTNSVLVEVKRRGKAMKKVEDFPPISYLTDLHVNTLGMDKKKKKKDRVAVTFGSSTKRFVPHLTPETPTHVGPGSYNPWKEDERSKKSNVPGGEVDKRIEESSAFKSTTGRYQDSLQSNSRTDFLPPSYNTAFPKKMEEESPQEKKKKGTFEPNLAGVAFRSRSPRMVRASTETDGLPCSYLSERHVSSVGRKIEMGKRKARKETEDGVELFPARRGNVKAGKGRGKKRKERRKRKKK